MSRATLNDLVEDLLRLELGYGEEFVVNNEIGTLYDADETENLAKKLSELGTCDVVTCILHANPYLGIKGDSFLTVIDEDEENPRVNLILSVQESTSPMVDKPFKSLDITKPNEGESLTSIPRRQKVSPESNGVAPTVNGTIATNGASTGAPNGSKRTASEAIQDESPLSKRPKTISNGTNGTHGANSTNGTAAKSDLIVIDDSANGAILIDDD